MKALLLLTLVPMAVGPLPQEERTLTMSICNGGEITVPIGGKDQDRKRDCHQEACHAGTCRDKAKLMKK